MKNPWTTLTTKPQYDNPWVHVVEHEVLNPKGKPGIYGVVRFKNLAIGVIPIDADGSTVLVGQYRYPLETYSWEIPEGGGSASVTTRMAKPIMRPRWARNPCGCDFKSSMRHARA